MENDLMVINKSDYQSDRQSLVAQTERGQMAIGHLENDIKILRESLEKVLAENARLREAMGDVNRNLFEFESALPQEILENRYSKAYLELVHNFLRQGRRSND